MCTSAHQVPLKECERLDQSLALALRHLTLPCPRAETPQQGLGTGAPAEALAVEHADTSVEANLDKLVIVHMETGVDTETHTNTCAGGLTHAMEPVDPLGENTTGPENRIGDYHATLASTPRSLFYVTWRLGTLARHRPVQPYFLSSLSL